MTPCSSPSAPSQHLAGVSKLVCNPSKELGPCSLPTRSLWAGGCLRAGSGPWCRLGWHSWMLPYATPAVLLTWLNQDSLEALTEVMKLVCVSALF